MVLAILAKSIKKQKNRSKILHRRSQGAPKAPQDSLKPTKETKNGSKTPPTCLQTLQETPKACHRHTQDTPRLPKTHPDSPKTCPIPRQSSIFEGAKTKNEHPFTNATKHQSIQISKHPNGDGGLREAFRRPTAGGAAC